MDRPDLDARLHKQALQALDRVNSVSLTARGIWREIEMRLNACGSASDVGNQQNHDEYSVLDVACGSGSVLLGIKKHAARAGVSLRLAGCDQSATALAVARVRSNAVNTDTEFYEADVTQQPFTDRYDFVISSLFLHHLTDAEAATLLSRMADAARLGLIVTDLRRTRLGYALAWTGTRLLSRSPVARIDGPRSVSRAFTSREAAELAARAGLSGATVHHCWPQRFALVWWRP